MPFELTLHESRETPHAMIHMDNVVTRLKVRVDRFGSLRGDAGAHPGSRTFPAEDLRVGDEKQIAKLPAFSEGGFEESDRRWIVDGGPLIPQLFKSAALPRDNDNLPAIIYQLREIFFKRFEPPRESFDVTKLRGETDH